MRRQSQGHVVAWAVLASRASSRDGHCTRLCLGCTDVCTATLGVVSRQTADDPTITGPLLEACVATCKSCSDKSERHAPTIRTAGSASKPAGSYWAS
jgi:hypothetical protein